MPFDMSIKFLVQSASILLLAACGETAAVSVKCGMSGDDAELRETLVAHDGCAECLLDKVEAVVESCPKDAAVGTLGFYASERAKSYRGAADFYERVAEVPGVSFQVHADAGFLLYKLGDKPGAIAAYRRSLIGRNDPFVRFEAARIMVEMDLLDAAISELRTVMADTEQARRHAIPGQVGSEAVYDDAVFELADAFKKKGDSISSMKVYEDFLLLYPNDMRASEALEALGKHEAD